MEKSARKDRQGPILKAGDFLHGGRFAVLRLLGRGGMGEVWCARDLHQPEGDAASWVAIKVLRPQADLDAELERRLHHEFEALKRMAHRNLVRAYCSGTDPDRGVFYYVMEYLIGTTLQHAIEKTGGLPLVNGLRMVAQVARAAHTMHLAGVIHRDLKPDNIMLARPARPAPQGRQPLGASHRVRAVVIDVGIAKCDPTHFPGRSLHTDPEVLLGTMDYMSPEQCIGGHLDGRSDVYAVGLIAWVAAVGRHPAQPHRDAPLPRDFRWWSGFHLNQEPKPLFDVASWIHPRVWEVVGRALAKKREDRYRTAAELAKALEELSDWLQERGLSNPPRRERFSAAAYLPFATTGEVMEPVSGPAPVPVSSRTSGAPASGVPFSRGRSATSRRPGALPAAVPTICGVQGGAARVLREEVGETEAGTVEEDAYPEEAELPSSQGAVSGMVAKRSAGGPVASGVASEPPATRPAGRGRSGDTEPPRSRSSQGTTPWSRGEPKSVPPSSPPVVTAGGTEVIRVSLAPGSEPLRTASGTQIIPLEEAARAWAAAPAPAPASVTSPLPRSAGGSGGGGASSAPPGSARDAGGAGDAAGATASAASVGAARAVDAEAPKGQAIAVASTAAGEEVGDGRGSAREGGAPVGSTRMARVSAGGGSARRWVLACVACAAAGVFGTIAAGRLGDGEVQGSEVRPAPGSGSAFGAASLASAAEPPAAASASGAAAAAGSVADAGAGEAPAASASAAAAATGSAGGSAGTGDVRAAGSPGAAARPAAPRPAGSAARPARPAGSSKARPKSIGPEVQEPLFRIEERGAR